MHPKGLVELRLCSANLNNSCAYRETLNHVSRSPLLWSDFFFFYFSSVIFSFPLSVGNCTNPTTPPNGVRSPSGSTFQFRDVIHYSCKPGFRLVGNRTFACSGKGRSNFTGNLTCERGRYPLLLVKKFFPKAINIVVNMVTHLRPALNLALNAAFEKKQKTLKKHY